MKLLILSAALLMNASAFAQGNKPAKKEISALLTKISSALETRNTELLEPLLNENFRVIAHRFPSDDHTTVLTREAYFSLLKAGKIGGEKRTVNILSLDINEHIATAKVVFESDKAIFTTYQSFLLDKNNTWQLVSDMPIVKTK